MKLNNKGVTLIEIIVSISLISIVLLFLFRLLIVVKNADDKSVNQMEYEEKTSLVMKYFQDEIKEAEECEGSIYHDPDVVELECSTGLTGLKIYNDYISLYTFEVETGQEVNKKDVVFPKGATISNLRDLSEGNLLHYEIIVTDDKDNEYPIEIVYLNK